MSVLLGLENPKRCFHAKSCSGSHTGSMCLDQSILVPLMTNMDSATLHHAAEQAILLSKCPVPFPPHLCCCSQLESPFHSPAALKLWLTTPSPQSLQGHSGVLAALAGGPAWPSHQHSGPSLVLLAYVLPGVTIASRG